ncbi:MAG: Na+-transporting NADH:ubiquinone oxidoreductase subunit 3 [Gemmatimonadota bacterium]|nr:MAG: Na+-transporting NADH:ubiquinone oxidoreductase subunit 3 [Gemmatimonadota bacterium]
MNASSTATPTGTWPMYRAMVGVGLVCGILIVTVFRVTLPVIERNQAEALQQAIFQVLPAARSSETFQAVDGGFRPLGAAAPTGELVYGGYDDSGALIGLAVEAQGMGYQDIIRVLYGYSFEENAIVGLRVLESKETPGLGDRIETDPAFVRNFERLDVSLSEDQTTLAHPIHAVKTGEKEHAWQVDGITGATISSKAIAEILDRSGSAWVPRIRRALDQFRKADQP